MYSVQTDTSYAWLRPKQSIALNAHHAKTCKDIQLRFERIDYVVAFRSVLEQTNETVVMLKVLRDLDPFQSTLDNALLYCKYWCCLHKFLQQHKTEKLSIELLFNLNTHVTNSYTIQLLVIINRTTLRGVRFVLEKILEVPIGVPKKHYKSWLQPFEIEELSEAFEHLSELLGLLHYAVTVCMVKSKWAVEKITETCQTLQERYDILRGLLFWVSGELEISSAQARRHQEIADWLGTSWKVFCENTHLHSVVWLHPIFHRIKTLQLINKGQYHSIVLNKQSIASEAFEYAIEQGWQANEQANQCINKNSSFIVKKPHSITPHMFAYIGPLPSYKLDKFKKGIDPLEFIQLKPQKTSSF